MTLYEITDEDAKNIACEYGLERPLTKSELKEIKKSVEIGMEEIWYEIIEDAVKSSVEELKDKEEN